MTALLVPGNSLSSRYVSAFSRFGVYSFSRARLILLNRRTRARSFSSRAKAVAARQRRSNKR